MQSFMVPPKGIVRISILFQREYVKITRESPLPCCILTGRYIQIAAVRSGQNSERHGKHGQANVLLIVLQEKIRNSLFPNKDRCFHEKQDKPLSFVIPQ